VWRVTWSGPDRGNPRRPWKLLCAAALTLTLLPAQAAGQDVGDVPITTGDPEADDIIILIEQMVEDASVAKSRLRSDHLDLEVLLEQIGDDPAGITRWVAEETRWLPYRGALRGASGVLMDRTGNSLDRALLLAELLALTGADVRLAGAQLPPELASAMAESSLAMTGGPTVVEPDFGDADEVAAYRSSVESAAAVLADAVGLLDRAPDPASAEVPTGSASDHWWVQASVDGSWVDLDPQLVSMGVGLPAPERTFTPDELPDDLRHTATIRVVIERAVDDELVEEAPLQHTVLLGRDDPLVELDLSFDVAVSPEDTERAAATRDVGEAAELSAYWRPRLERADEVVRGEWFSAAGILEGPSASAAADALSRGVSALGGLGAAADDGGAADSRLTAVWIEYETDGPDLEPRVERRELIDVLDGARTNGRSVDPSPSDDEARGPLGLAFLGETSILVQAASTHPDAFTAAFLDSVISMRSSLIAQVFLKVGVDDERIAPSLASGGIRPFDLLAMTSARDRWSPTAHAFLASPNVWTRRFFYAQGPDGPQPGAAIDVAINDVAIAPTAAGDMRLIRLEQGILDTFIEHVLAPTDDGYNTWERFDQRTAEGTEWMALLPGSTVPDELRTALPAADVSRVQAAIDDGDAVVVAVDARSYLGKPFADWWRIGADGKALGVGYRGWGQELKEEADVTQQISLRSLQPLLDADRSLMWRRIITEQRRMLVDHFAKLPFADTQPMIKALEAVRFFLF